MEISRDRFTKLIRDFKKLVQKENEAIEILGLTEGFIRNMMGFCYETLLFAIYGEDIPEYNDLDYFIYELDFGSKYTDGCYTVDGVEIKLQTIDDLYNCLVRDGYIVEPEEK